MNKKSIKDIDITGKRVIMRVDFNVPQDKVTGASVHRVDPFYDHGEVIAQQEVDISDCKSPEEIADRVLSIEHQLYAPAIYTYLSQNPL